MKKSLCYYFNTVGYDQSSKIDPLHFITKHTSNVFEFLKDSTIHTKHSRKASFKNKIGAVVFNLKRLQNCLIKKYEKFYGISLKHILLLFTSKLLN